MILSVTLMMLVLFQNFVPVGSTSVGLPDDDCPLDSGFLITNDSAVKADGITDVSGAFRRALNNPKIRTICVPAGNYFFGQRIEMPKNRMINIRGLNSSDIQSTIISFSGTTIPFYSNTLNGDENKVVLFRAQNLTFDGMAVEEDFVKNRSSTRALSLVAAKDVESMVEINNVHFRNMNNLPIWLEGFSNVRILNSRFSKTKDPGILRAKRVIISGNLVEDTFDNCVSISRGNSNVSVTNNVLKNCGGAGIFVGGIAYEGNWNLPAGGTPMSLMVKPTVPDELDVGDTCELASNRDYFRDKMISTYQTVKDPMEKSSNFVIVEVTNFKSSLQVGCRFVTKMPSSLVGVASERWIDGPHFAGENVEIRGNRIEGSREYGIKLSMAPRGVSIADNLILQSGRRVDPFHPENVTTHGSFGILVMGWYLAPVENAYRYAERIYVSRNKIVDASYGGIRVGSNYTGSVRNIALVENEIELNGDLARVGVLVDGIQDEALTGDVSKAFSSRKNMPTYDLVVAGNTANFGADASGTAQVKVRMLSGDACEAFKRLDIKSQGKAACAFSVIKLVNGSESSVCLGSRAPLLNFCPK